jgi:hypothetical protein
MPTILLPTDSTATVLDSYADLLAAVSNWLHRDLSAQFPTFLLLAEERINRLVRCRDMEVELSATTLDDDYQMTQPTDMVAVKSFYASGYEDEPIKITTYDKLLSIPEQTRAKNFAWVGSVLYFDGPGTIYGTYLEKVAALSSTNITNWLIQKHPSCYLSAVLTEAFIYVRDDTESTRWDGRFLQIVAEINGKTQHDTFSGPLTVRVR